MRILRRIDSGLLRRAGVLALVGVGLTGAEARAVAQEPDRPGGWLGVRVRQNYECEWSGDERPANCDLVIDITEIQTDGPAQRGGLLPGDRMIAINGQNLTFQTWDPLRESIRAGTPVSIDVRRDSTRYFMRVTPAVRSTMVEEGSWSASLHVPARGCRPSPGCS